MSVENLGLARQYDFSRGPNYTDSIIALGEAELAESDNCYFEGGLKTIPGAARLVTVAVSGTTKTITGIYDYAKKTGVRKFIITTGAGHMKFESAGSWTDITTALSTAANTFWDWATFNDTMIAASGSNPVKKYDGTTLSNLGGSPPQSRFVSVHGDYVFLAGHTAQPSQVRYSDTALHNVWPVGNVLNVGLDDGQIITGLQRLGDVTVVFKDSSIHTIAGPTPADFIVSPTISEVGCISPNSIVLTDAGIFFWSEAGPAIFDGFRTTLLGRRLRTILDGVDWDNSLKVSAAYYPYRKQLLGAFQRTGQSTPDRMLLLDLYRLGDENSPTNFWHLTFGSTTLGEAEDSVGRRRIYIGTSDGFVCAWDSGTTFNNATIVSRARTRVMNLGRPDKVLGMRTIDMWIKSTSGNLVTRYSMNSATTFTQQSQTPTSMLESGKSIKFIRLDGDGAGVRPAGRLIQLEFENVTTAMQIHGYEIGAETLSSRND